MQVQLCVRQLAERRSMRIADLQRAAGVPTVTIRRYWYASRSGLERDSGSLRDISLPVIARIAAALGVAPGDLLKPIQE